MTTTPNKSVKGLLIPDPYAAGVSVTQTIGSTIELNARNPELAEQYFHLCLSAFGFSGEAAASYARQCGIQFLPGWSDVADSEL